MPQVELEEQDLEKVDKLVKNGIFLNRERAVKAGLESLLELPEEEIKRMEKAKHEASMYLEVYMGNMLYPSTPLRVVIDGKELYKVPVKSASDEINSVLLYVYVDSQTLEVDNKLSTSLTSLPNMSNEELGKIKKVQAVANSYCEAHLGNKLIAGAPLKDNIEGKECFRVILTGENKGKTYICGYLFLDAETLAVDDCIILEKYMKQLN